MVPQVVEEYTSIRPLSGLVSDGFESSTRRTGSVGAVSVKWNNFDGIYLHKIISNVIEKSVI